MLKREREFSSTNVYTPLHCCRDLLGKSFYVHIIDGVVLHNDEISSQYNQEKFPLSGGILCDEMGLGKTMCVLLTSLLNRCSEDFLKENITQSIHDEEDEGSVNYKKFKFDDPVDLPCLCGKIAKRNSNITVDSTLICNQCSRYVHKTCFIREEQETFLCPYCEQRLSNTSELLPTKATLIIAPGAIIDQWIEEISKHLDYPLDIYMYEGVVNKIPIPDRHYLAKQDFIFCSYENLRKDIHHNEACSQELHSTRTHVRKYEYLISPLLRMKFWRLGSFCFILGLLSFSLSFLFSISVLDEAQM